MSLPKGRTRTRGQSIYVITPIISSSMSKLNMRLSPNDEEKINILREKYGILLSSEIVRLALSIAATSVNSAGQPAPHTQQKHP
ncbi:MAG: hypothetical protein WA323_26430 [Candidatus Nitrosopolaris sp.]